MVVKSAVVDSINERNRTYHLILDFGTSKSKVRMFCKEEQGGKPIVYSISVMDGRCPCCHKDKCPSLSTKGDDFIAQVRRLANFRLKDTTGLSLVFD